MRINSLLYDSLVTYFQDCTKNKILIKTLDKQDGLSLRLIDWFITNYSKKYNIFYLIYKTKDGELTINGGNNNVIYSQFNVYQSYKSQLKAYSKKKFDPFCRRDRMIFESQLGKIETTIGQLNFFKWAISNLIIEYINIHKNEIEEDMNQSLKNMKLKHTNEKGRKKRQELSISASRGLNKNRLCVLLDFN